MAETHDHPIVDVSHLPAAAVDTANEIRDELLRARLTIGDHSVGDRFVIGHQGAGPVGRLAAAAREVHHADGDADRVVIDFGTGPDIELTIDSSGCWHATLREQHPAPAQVVEDSADFRYMSFGESDDQQRDGATIQGDAESPDSASPLEIDAIRRRFAEVDSALERVDAAVSRLRRISV